MRRKWLDRRVKQQRREVSVDRHVADARHGFAVDLPCHVTADDGAAVTGAVTHANQGFAH